MTYEMAVNKLDEILEYLALFREEDLYTVGFRTTCKRALKSKIPKKVKYIEYTTDGHLLGYCPKCTLKILDENKFCYECGQALDWSE